MLMRAYLGQLALVGAGGFFGAAARFALSGLAHRLAPLSTFPYGTLAVNVLGSLVIGFLGGLMELRGVLGQTQRLIFLVGFLGSFTTFSTFSWETLGLLHSSELGRAGANVAAHFFLGLAAVWIGYLGAQSL